MSNRLICFCFNHTENEIIQDLLTNSISTIKLDIIEQCKLGNSDCRNKNPAGKCCLGNITKLIRQTEKQALSEEENKEKSACCDPLEKS
jgi:hypothetical protein